MVLETCVVVHAWKAQGGCMLHPCTTLNNFLTRLPLPEDPTKSRLSTISFTYFPSCLVTRAHFPRTGRPAAIRYHFLQVQSTLTPRG